LVSVRLFFSFSTNDVTSSLYALVNDIMICIGFTCFITNIVLGFHFHFLILKEDNLSWSLNCFCFLKIFFYIHNCDILQETFWVIWKIVTKGNERMCLHLPNDYISCFFFILKYERSSLKILGHNFIGMICAWSSKSFFILFWYEIWKNKSGKPLGRLKWNFAGMIYERLILNTGVYR